MYIKIILFITMSLSLRDRNGIQCNKQIIDTLLKFEKKNIDTFNTLCYYSLILNLYTEKYSTNWNEFIRTKQMYAEYYLRLLRVIESNSSIQMTFNTEIWEFYIQYKTFQPLQSIDTIQLNEIKNKAKQHIIIGITKEIWPDLSTKVYILSATNIPRMIDNIIIIYQSVEYKDILQIYKVIEYYLNTFTGTTEEFSFDYKSQCFIDSYFKHCQKTLVQLTNSTRYVDVYISRRVMKKELYINDYFETYNILANFGYIFLLCNTEEEFTKLMDANDKNKKIIVIDHMLNTLKHIFEGMLIILLQMNDSIRKAGDDVLNMNPGINSNMDTVIDINEVYEAYGNTDNLYTILKKMYFTAINTTEAIYGIQEDRKILDDDEQVNVIKKQDKFISYNFFIKTFQAMWGNKKYKVSEEYLQYIKRGINSRGDKLFSLNVHFNTYLVKAPLIGYYGMSDLSLIINWLTITKFDKRITFLLNLNIWLLVLDENAVKMKADKSLKTYTDVEDFRPLYEKHRKFFRV